MSRSKVAYTITLRFKRQFLARDRCVRKKRILALQIDCVRLSVCLGRACIVITRFTLARIWVYGWIIQCHGHPDTKACPPTSSRFFQFHLEERWGMDLQTRCVISQERLKYVTMLSYCWVLIGSHATSISTTTDDLEWPWMAVSCISEVAEPLIFIEWRVVDAHT